MAGNSADAVTLFVCGPRDCPHQWDGPEVPLFHDDGKTISGSSVTCSLCGMSAIDHSLWTDD